MDQEIRNLERALQADPKDKKARLDLFQAKARLNPETVSSVFKIRQIATGNYLTANSYRIRFSKTGKAWKTLDSLNKAIAKFSEGNLIQLKGCQVVELQTMESAIPGESFDAILRDYKLQQLAAQTAALEAQKARLMKEIEDVKAGKEKK